MKSLASAAGVLAVALAAGSCRDPMEHAHCDDTLVKGVPSPDGKLEINIYNRACGGDSPLRASRMTYAAVHDPKAPLSWPRRTDVCGLVTLGGGYRRMDAMWTDARHIRISTLDEIEPEWATSDRPATCGDIAVTYALKIKPTPGQEAPDVQTIQDIRQAIDQSESCFKQKFAAGHADYLRRQVDDGQHRHTLELLCTNLVAKNCPISRETYGLLARAGRAMDIPASYLEDLKPQVQDR